MAKGGARKGAGRKKGSANKKSIAIANAAAESGITPLEVIIEAMREAYSTAQKSVDEERSKWMALAAQHAKDAAPYMHPRLQPVDAGGSSDQTMTVKIVQYAGSNPPE